MSIKGGASQSLYAILAQGVLGEAGGGTNSVGGRGVKASDA